MSDHTGRKRCGLEKFYTKQDISSLCIQDMLNTIKPSPSDIFLEPSAGNGSFLAGLDDYKVEAIDLFPEHPYVRQQDFFTYNPPPDSTIHVIGNPPFGRQSSLAVKFIKKASEFANTISFILPKSFKKDSLKNKIPISFHLILEKDLPPNSFYITTEEETIDHNVPCVFQIWKRLNHTRTLSLPEECTEFEFVSRDDNPHISFRRVGVNAGTISTDTSTKNTQTHYFIRFLGTDTDKFIERIKALSFCSMDHTVGPRSISKNELIKEWNKSK